MKQTSKVIKINRLIFLLALLGIVIAIYVLQSFVRDAPVVCINSGCELVRKNPASYILGIPVPTFGLIGYTLIAILAFLRTIERTNKLILLKGMLAMSTFGIGFITWFTYTEILVIKAICTWCAVSGINMVVVWLLIIKSFSWEKGGKNI